MIPKRKDLQLTSTAFKNGEEIPVRYTCDGENISPPFDIAHLPRDTESLALIVEDPDAPRGTWTHWLVWDIAPTDKIEEGSIPGTEGTNDFGKTHYGGPCPPSGTHRYYFKLYALDKMLGVKEGAGRQSFMKAAATHVLGTAEIMGTYSR
ncbi:MAG: YbhB/YbcL family Raf kinase inhibitor-like protein [Hymenobacteraceae bacterium]|nr:YbhB/YbcL family Raf kinase inhibitor-like protein [Hymenobacteraceae bacterium]MDX5480359.1 YbhB/YbcL family Raf kinase inhibitor-like protein [Hymenobacteraceae bacterium]